MDVLVWQERRITEVVDLEVMRAFFTRLFARRVSRGKVNYVSFRGIEANTLQKEGGFPLKTA